MFDQNQNSKQLKAKKKKKTIPPFSDVFKYRNSELVKKSCPEQLMKLEVEIVRRNIIAQYFYNVKNGSSNITSKSLSKNLSNENKQWCFCCLQDKA